MYKYRTLPLAHTRPEQGCNQEYNKYMSPNRQGDSFEMGYNSLWGESFGGQRASGWPRPGGGLSCHFLVAGWLPRVTVDFIGARHGL